MKHQRLEVLSTVEMYLFLKVLEACVLRLGYQQGQVRASSRSQTSFVSSHGGRGKGALLIQSRIHFRIYFIREVLWGTWRAQLVQHPTDFGSSHDFSREFSKRESGSSFIRGPIPFMKALHSLPNHFPNVPPPNTVTVGVRIPTGKVWGDTHIQTIAQGIIALEVWAKWLRSQRKDELILMGSGNERDGSNLSSDLKISYNVIGKKQPFKAERTAWSWGSVQKIWWKQVVQCGLKY